MRALASDGGPTGLGIGGGPVGFYFGFATWLTVRFITGFAIGDPAGLAVRFITSFASGCPAGFVTTGSSCFDIGLTTRFTLGFVSAELGV